MIKSSGGNNRDISHYVFSGSTTMVGVCITIIALFRVMNVGAHTLADEILSVNTLLFILAAVFSYSSLRSRRYRLERVADFLFIAGMIIMLAVGIIIIYTTY